jgi:hypothetical protein
VPYCICWQKKPPPPPPIPPQNFAKFSQVSATDYGRASFIPSVNAVLKLRHPSELNWTHL